jgi:hypothetical protein
MNVENLRCFSGAQFDLRFPGEHNDTAMPNVNLLLGDNGSGKSTVLRAIALAALGPVLDSSGFVPYKYVKEGAKQASIDCDFLFNASHEPTLLSSHITVDKIGDLEKVQAAAESPHWSDLYVESSPSFFVVGYGTNRRVGDDSRSDLSLERGRQRRRYQRVSSLFDDSISLVPFGGWLPQADAGLKADVSDLLERLLPEGTHFTGDFEGKQPIFGSAGVEVPLRAMSDGFRSYIGWLGDLLFQMSAALPSGVRLQDIGGIRSLSSSNGRSVAIANESWRNTV